MYKILLGDNEAIELRNELSSIWDISHPYWYPLYDCARDDVIAFDSEYVESINSIDYIRKLLIEHGVDTLFEFRENGISSKIEELNDYEFWLSDRYFWNNECFWSDKNMDWIIYVSHEGITTFGGKWLIDELKFSWVDWRNKIKWDTKNLT